LKTIQLSSYSSMKEQFDDFFSRKPLSTVAILDWLVENETKMDSKLLVKALTTSVIEFCMDVGGIPHTIKDSELQKIKPVIVRCLNIDNDCRHQMEMLYTAQVFVHKLGHPQGLLKNIVTAFYDLEFLTEDAVLSWIEEDPKHEKEGRERALTSISQFISWLKETED